MTPAPSGFLDRLLQGTLHPLLLLNADGNVQEANRAALEFIGIARGDALDRPLWDLAPWNSSPDLAADLQRAVREAVAGTQSRHDMDSRNLSFTVSPAMGSLVVEGQDITQLKHALEESAHDWNKVKFAFAAANMASWSWDVGTDTVTSHPFIDRLFGLPPATRVPRADYISAIHPEDRQRLMDETDAAVATRSGFRSEIRGLLPDGTVRWAMASGSVRCNDAGVPIRVDGITIDITERKEAELRLRESEARFRAMFENAGVGIALVNHEGVLTECNPALAQLLGYSSEELRHMSFPQFTHKDDVERDWAKFQDLIAGLSDRYAVEKRYWRKNGQLIWAHLVVSLVRDAEGKPLFSIGMVEDITQRRVAEQELRALSEKLINTQEQERTRMARELHDDIAQQLAALSISVSNLKRTISASDVELRTQTDRLHQRLAGAAESVRRLSHELHPAVLEHSGIAAALESYCEKFSVLNHIEVSLDAEGRFDDISPAVALCLYRVTQEALQNVAKHSAAKQAHVELSRSNGQVHLKISDEGRGFEAARSVPRAGLGLVSMKERARLVNGTLHIDSAPGKGTRLRVSIPI
ncbi:MAG TPA: PAS domain S-box protein [Bryobacteraceae bacterium]|jgi:PAS domain S-box-containing protein